MEREEIDLRVFYVTAEDKNRLMRQLSRENSPNIDEIIRRYATDKQDFADYNIAFTFTEIENNNDEDFENCLATIQAFAQDDYSL